MLGNITNNRIYKLNHCISILTLFSFSLSLYIYIYDTNTNMNNNQINKTRLSSYNLVNYENQYHTD